MKDLILRFNQWYDKILEPWRFLLFLATLIPGIVAPPPISPLWLSILFLVRVYPRLTRKPNPSQKEPTP